MDHLFLYHGSKKNSKIKSQCKFKAMFQVLKFDPVKLDYYFRMFVRDFDEAAQSLGYMFAKKQDVTFFLSNVIHIPK